MRCVFQGYSTHWRRLKRKLCKYKLCLGLQDGTNYWLLYLLVVFAFTLKIGQIIYEYHVYFVALSAVFSFVGHL